MNCQAFDLWLDGGMEESAEAVAHAKSCTRCAPLLEAALSEAATSTYQVPIGSTAV